MRENQRRSSSHESNQLKNGILLVPRKPSNESLTHGSNTSMIWFPSLEIFSHDERQLTTFCRSAAGTGASTGTGTGWAGTGAGMGAMALGLDLGLSTFVAWPAAAVLSFSTTDSLSSFPLFTVMICLSWKEKEIVTTLAKAWPFLRGGACDDDAIRRWSSSDWVQ
jgi:hypothetical protein